MSGNPGSRNSPDPEWEQKINKLKALELVEREQHQVEFTCLQAVYTAAKGGALDKFIIALEKYSTERTASLYDIISTKDLLGNSLFHFAAATENADILQALLEIINNEQLATQANDRGDTALHFAARASRIGTAEHLLNFCSDVDQPNQAGDWPLHEAVKNGDCEFAQLLLRRGSSSVNKKNKEGKCPVYLAVETGNLEILLLLLPAVDGNEVLSSRNEGMSPVHGAVMHRRIDMLIEMSNMKRELFDLENGTQDTPLHLAARENYVDGVQFLVREFASSAFKHNKDGYFPIHVACEMGHLETIKVLHQCWQNLLEPEELLTEKWQNILHVAAKNGRAHVVKYMLGDPKFERLLNAKDKYGNTPLHSATKHWQPGVLLSLTRDSRVNLRLVNHNNSTALDIVDDLFQEIEGPLHQSLTRIILISAKAPRSKDKAILVTSLRPQRDPPHINILKTRAEVRMVVATLIAGVTFAAGFSVPGGFNSSKPDIGIATLLDKPMYDIFVICNSIAMYNSIIAVVILLWTQIDDSYAVFHALEMTRLPLLIALATMSMAFMAGVYVTISKRTWVAVIALVAGVTALFVILILYIALFIPLGYNYRLVQFFADYIIRAAMSISRRENVSRGNSRHSLRHAAIAPGAGWASVSRSPPTRDSDWGPPSYPRILRSYSRVPRSYPCVPLSDPPSLPSHPPSSLSDPRIRRSYPRVPRSYPRVPLSDPPSLPSDQPSLPSDPPSDPPSSPSDPPSDLGPSLSRRNSI